jgi:hypothetical protein
LRDASGRSDPDAAVRWRNRARFLNVVPVLELARFPNAYVKTRGLAAFATR